MNSAYKSFFTYANENGVVQRANCKINISKKRIKQEFVIEHLSIISEFHKKIMGYDNYIGYRLEDKRGRDVEQFKIYAKNVRRLYKKIKEKPVLNDFEKIFLEYGFKYIDRAEKCIDLMYSSGYLELLKRSMKRKEICLGDSYFTNIKKEKVIQVRDLSKCFYNLIEFDGIYLINKLIKKGIHLNYENLVCKFCEFEQLDERSVEFIKSYISYPYEFIKCCLRYKKDKNNLNYKKLIEKINKAIAYSERSLLI